MYDIGQVENAVNACMHIIQSNKSRKSIFKEVDGEKLFLSINSIKIAKCPKRVIRLLLKHSFLADNSEICFFVKDHKFGKKISSEKTIDFYENLLKHCNLTLPIKKIITYNQLKTEYDQYELKQRLCNQFDLFLVDVEISKDISILLTTLFAKKHKAPVPISLNRKYSSIENQINNTLKKTSFRLSDSSFNVTFQVGTSVMKPTTTIVDNICSALDQFDNIYPGSWSNIRSVNLLFKDSYEIPIYYSFKSRNDVEVPVILSKKSKFSTVVSGELSTFNDVEVDVHPDGFVKIKRLKK